MGLTLTGGDQTDNEEGRRYLLLISRLRRLF